MTEQEWIESGDPCAMLKHLTARRKASASPEAIAPRPSSRQLRLFGCGCLRLVWQLITETPIREAVETCEGYADRRATFAELTGAANRVTELEHPRRPKVACMLGVALGYIVGKRVTLSHLHGIYVQCCSARCQARSASWNGSQGKEWLRASRAQADLLRDLFGNPFRPVAVDPTWLTASVLGLAQEVYEKRAFDLLPVLGDALEDAGCGEAVILDHLRGGGEHARGCWVVDALTGRG